MSKHQKNISLNILYVFFLTIVGVQNSNSASAYEINGNNLGLEIREEIKKVSNLKSTISRLNYSSSRDINNVVVHTGQEVLEAENKIQFYSPIKPGNLNTEGKDSVTTEILITDVSLDIFTGNSPENNEIESESSIALNLVRKISLFFFLLFFLPLGIFYPFFLLYKKLLDFDEDTNPIEEEVFESSLPISSSIEDIELDLYSDQAIISKLQVAFLPEIVNLKQQLEQARLNIDEQGESRALDFMRSAISIFITQQYWTHANLESLSCSSIEAPEKFDTILSVEQDKYIAKKLSVVNIGQSEQRTGNYIAQDNFKYTVVTMVFYTLGSDILFEQINTKESLAKLLIDLSQINKNDLLKFELIWNPLKEDEFITNEELLIHYEDMVRLL